MNFKFFKNKCFYFFLFFFLLFSPLLPPSLLFARLRIISLSPFITESLYILGLQNEIVGTTIYDRTPGMQSRPKVGTLLTINIEKIVSLKPDLVLATDLTPSQQLNKLKKFGIRVETFSFWKSAKTLFSEFIRLGKVVGREKLATKLVKEITREIKEIHNKVKNLPKPRVVVEIGVNPLWVAPQRSFINDYIVLAGGKNVGPRISGRITRETLIKLNPDVIIISDMGFSAEEEVKKWQKYPFIPAVKNKRIYIISSDDLCSPTPPRFLHTLKLLAKLFHPDIKFKEKLMKKKIKLPSELKASAIILEKEDIPFYWEKSLIIKFNHKRRVLSTMQGFLFARVVVNHSASPLMWKYVCYKYRKGNKCGGLIYMEKEKKEIAKLYGISPEEIALIATAADMDNLAVVTKKFANNRVKLLVTALVTAGARGNALRTGLDKGWYLDGKNLKEHGTVNIIILTNVKLTDGAMARAVITATEAKTAVFQDLKIPSTYTPGVIATGTGTDNVIIVSGIKSPEITYTGGHSKIGELIGKAVYQAVSQALCKQNGFCLKKTIIKDSNSHKHTL